MTFNKYYQEKFSELVALEEKARDLYQYNIDRVQDPKLLEVFTEIHNDELRHIQIASRLLEIFSL